MQFSSSDELCEYIKAQSDTVLLSFSRGKDSLAAYVQLRRHDFRIVPVHYYLVPGLSFIRESLDYYERLFGCHIYDLPGPSLYRMLGELIYQPPERCRHIEAAGLTQYTYDQLFAIVKLTAGLPVDTYTAVGVTINDSLNRRATINKHGPVNEKRRQFFPIYDWPRSRIITEVRSAGIALPKDYRMFGRTFDGIDHRFVAPIKEHYPADYERIKDVFPLVDLELARMDYRAKHFDTAQEITDEPQYLV